MEERQQSSAFSILFQKLPSIQGELCSLRGSRRRPPSQIHWDSVDQMSKPLMMSRKLLSQSSDLRATVISSTVLSASPSKRDSGSSGLASKVKSSSPIGKDRSSRDAWKLCGRCFPPLRRQSTTKAAQMVRRMHSWEVRCATLLSALSVGWQTTFSVASNLGLSACAILIAIPGLWSARTLSQSAIVAYQPASRRESHYKHPNGGD